MIRPFLIFSLVVFAFFSCGEPKPTSTEEQQDSLAQVDTIILTDSMEAELRHAHDLCMELYTSEQFNKYVEYLYPGYFTYAQKQKPSLTRQEVKDQYVEFLSQQNEKYWEQNIASVAPNAITYSFIFDSVECVVASGDNYLLLYSHQAIYHTGRGDIKKPHLEHGIATYIGKQKMWYFLDRNLPKIAEILQIDFAPEAVDSVLHQSDRHTE